MRDKAILWFTLKRMRLLIVVVVLSILAVYFVFGCQSRQKKVWGNGDLPSDWQGFFGADNVARLDFVQTNTINAQGQAIAVLAERVRKLEDPNEI